MEETGDKVQQGEEMCRECQERPSLPTVFHLGSAGVTWWGLWQRELVGEDLFWWGCVAQGLFCTNSRMRRVPKAWKVRAKGSNFFCVFVPEKLAITLKSTQIIERALKYWLERTVDLLFMRIKTYCEGPSPIPAFISSSESMTTGCNFSWSSGLRRLHSGMS